VSRHISITSYLDVMKAPTNTNTVAAAFTYGPALNVSLALSALAYRHSNPSSNAIGLPGKPRA
jgi:hypothetical protein